MGEPYYRDGHLELWHGDMRDILPTLDHVDAVVTDPPYGSTTATWDRWIDGWPDLVGTVMPESASLWSFGTARMFLDHADDFAGWKFGQEALWAKRNGSGPGSRDRLGVVHEWAYHWYRGRWLDLHHEWERERATANKGTVRRAASAAAHQRERRETTWVDDGTRQPRSVTWVIEAPSVRFEGRHPDEKPLKVVLPLVRECTPPGGTVLDPFAGAATTLLAAKMIGRRAVGIEASEATCEVAARRLSTPDLFTDAS